MTNTAEPDRLRTDPGEIDKLNQTVIQEFRANQGKLPRGILKKYPFIAGGATEGIPVALITMIGAKSGRTLTRPLCYAVDGDRIVIIASYGGAPKNPPWYYNLIKNPVVTVEVGMEKYPARAVQVYGAERKRLFEVSARIMPLFSDYQTKTEREIPVFILNRI